VDVQLIPAPNACCSNLSGADAYIGATVHHRDPNDDTSHELHVYWRDTPPGRQTVDLATFEPLVIDGELACPCGWTGTIHG